MPKVDKLENRVTHQTTVKTILLVEDEAVIAMKEEDILAKNGFKVKAVYTAEAAIQAVKTGEIGLVLMDIDLGEGMMDGTAAAETILSQQELPIVFLTSHTEKKMVEKVKGITRYGYVLKNAGEFVLIESINMAFELFYAYSALQKENRQREKTEKKLQETAALYRHLMENSIDAVYLLGETGNVLNANKVACEMIGYTKDELLALTIDDIDPNFPSQKFIEFWESKPEGSTVLFESLHKHKNGEIIPVEVNGIFFLLDGEKYLFGVAREIRKREKTEDALKKNSERYRKAQALGKVGNWEYNIRTTEFWGSDEAKRIYGFDPGSLSFSTEDVESCIPEQERVHQALVDLIEKEKEYNIEFEIITNDTRERKTIVSVAELEKDERGNPLKVTGVIHDITERKKIEERLRSAQKLVNTGYWDWFMDTGELIWSDEVYEIFGQNPDTFTVTAESFEHMIHPEDLHDFITEREQALAESRDVDIEHRIIKPDGEIRYVHEIAEIIRNEKGEVIQVKGVVQDITDRKHIEEKLSRALKQKDDLMQELNHRVKNNLLMVSSLIELKNDDLGDAADLSELLHQIDAVRILHENLYESEDTDHINMRAYIHDLLTLIFSTFSREHVIVKKSVDELRLPAKRAVPVGLIINEIATNAIKYGFTDDKDSEFAVELKKNPADDQCVLTVSNSGKPFPKEIELDNPKTLGLQLVSALVQQLQGTIELQRAPYPVFTVRFPISS